MTFVKLLDIFGIISFAIILYIGLKLKKKKTIKKGISYTLIAIGTLGLFVDLYIIFSAFIFRST